jgi:lipoprotein-anchoring transpeptidase ErfK/SrfK
LETEPKMSDLTRRALVTGAASLTAMSLAGCVASGPNSGRTVAGTVNVPPRTEELGGAPPRIVYSGNSIAMYGPVQDRFPIRAIDITRIQPQFLRQEVPYIGSEPPGTIVVDPRERFLYFTMPGARAMRYGVGVGREGFAWSGEATINSKQEWPDWYPPAEMIERQPEIRAQLSQLQSGQGVAGGLSNPLGARALYLWQNNRDTLYRIHGTLEPYSIGRNVSSGCIRMINQDAIDLYERVPIGTRVVVLS